MSQGHSSETRQTPAAAGPGPRMRSTGRGWEWGGGCRAASSRVCVGAVDILSPGCFPKQVTPFLPAQGIAEFLTFLRLGPSLTASRPTVC